MKIKGPCIPSFKMEKVLILTSKGSDEKEKEILESRQYPQETPSPNQRAHNQEGSSIMRQHTRSEKVNPWKW